MDKRLIMIAVILFFGCIGFSNSYNSVDTYNEMIPGLFNSSFDKSSLFLALVIILVGCYLLRSKVVALFYKNQDNPNDESLNDDSSPSENETSEELAEQDAIVNTEDEVITEDVIKEKYNVDER